MTSGCTDIHITGAPEGEESETEAGNTCEDVKVKSPLTWERKHTSRSGKDRVQARRAQRGQHQDRLQLKWQDSKTKRRYENRLGTYRAIPVKLWTDFSAETLEALREWHAIPEVMKGNSLSPRILCPARLMLIFEEETGSFAEKQRLRGELQFYRKCEKNFS